MQIEREDLLEQGSIPVNERWRNDLLKLWRGARAVVVSSVSDPEKKKGFSKIQRIKLQQQANSETPKEDLDDVIEAIAESIYGWLQRQIEEGKIEADEPKHFAIEVQRVLGKNDAPQRNKFYLTAAFEGDSDDPYDNPDIEAMNELERYRQMHMDSMQREIDALRVHSENLHETIIKLATINTAPMKEAASMLEMANGIAMQGFQATLNAATMRFNVEAHRAEQEEKTRRHQMWIQNVGQHVLPYIPNLGAWVVGKMRGENWNPPEPSKPGDTHGQDPDAYWTKRLHDLKSSITSEQHVTLSDALTKEELKGLMVLLSSSSAQEAFENYITLTNETITDLAAVLAALQEAFENEQAQVLIDLHMAVARWISENTPPDESGE